MNGSVESVLLCKAKAVVVGLAVSAASADVGPPARILLTAVCLKGKSPWSGIAGVSERVCLLYSFFLSLFFCFLCLDSTTMEEREAMGP